MHFTYCPDCGGKTVPRKMGDDGAVPYCECCDRPLFDVFHTCVLSVVMNPAGEIALIRQSYGDQSQYVGVAGYMQCGETAESAALREIKEEIGISAADIRFLFSAWHAKREQLMLCFCAQTDQSDFTLSPEVAEARWFSQADALQAVRQGSIIQQLVYAAPKMKK